MYSCITGELLKAEIVPFEYWRSSLELPVLFDQASQALFASHSTARYVVEIGPHSALAGPIRQITMMRKGVRMANPDIGLALVPD